MTVMDIKRTASLRGAGLWLPLVCVMLAFFGFASIACAAQCSGTNCAQMADNSVPPNSNDTQDFDIMMASGCILCCNIIINQAAFIAEQPLHPPFYTAVLAKQSSRHITPDIPPPRMFDIV
jgi:hypothetical protein